MRALAPRRAVSVVQERGAQRACGARDVDHAREPAAVVSLTVFPSAFGTVDDLAKRRKELSWQTHSRRRVLPTCDSGICERAEFARTSDGSRRDSVATPRRMQSAVPTPPV
jgi:hypothetical protein